MSYRDLLNACAQIVGGTHPTAAQIAAGSQVSATRRDDGTSLQDYWYSGADAGDGSGVQGLVGCFSLPTEVVDKTPVAMVLPDGWDPAEPFPTQGLKRRTDMVHVRVFVGNNDLQSLMAQLVNFADLIPQAFDTHMQLLQASYVATANCAQGRFLDVDWGGAAYTCLEFRVSILRGIPVTRQ